MDQNLPDVLRGKTFSQRACGGDRFIFLDKVRYVLKMVFWLVGKQLHIAGCMERIGNMNLTDKVVYIIGYLFMF